MNDFDVRWEQYKENEKELIAESEKLDKLAEESIKAGRLADDERVLEQTKKVNRLVLTSQKLEEMLEENEE